MYGEDRLKKEIFKERGTVSSFVRNLLEYRGYSIDKVLGLW